LLIVIEQPAICNQQPTTTNNQQSTMSFTDQERHDIQELFGAAPEQLDPETLKKTLRELRAKYHPDNFAKYGDAAVQQMATERFQRLERLAARLEGYWEGRSAAAPGPARPPAPSAPAAADPVDDPRARFAYGAMKVEIRTSDKDLKYHLFGLFYRWLTLGEKFKIPDTGAWLVADEAHWGRRIGFVESIRFFLTFEEGDPVETITGWLYERIAGRADTLLIEGDIVPIEYDAILLAIKRRSFRSLGATV
jgi:hypothetical protein